MWAWHPLPAPLEEALFFLGVAVKRRLGQGEENDFLAGCGADVVVQAQHLAAGDLLDHRFHDRPRRLDQVRAYLFEQVSALLDRERLDQLLFGRGQHAPEADDERARLEERITILRGLIETLDLMFDAFGKVRTGGDWTKELTKMQKWLQSEERGGRG